MYLFSLILQVKLSLFIAEKGTGFFFYCTGTTQQPDKDILKLFREACAQSCVIGNPMEGQPLPWALESCTAVNKVFAPVDVRCTYYEVIYTTQCRRHFN